MSKGIIETIGGAALVAVGALVEIGTIGGGTALASFLISAGAGLVLNGVGTLLSQGPVKGVVTSEKNPIAPWKVCYGRCAVSPATPIYINSFGSNDKWLDMVFVLAAHPCESVDELLFDKQRVQIGAYNTSFTPVQQNVIIASIQRIGNQVTVTLQADIPLLDDGDQVIIQQVPTDLTYNGKFTAFNVNHTPGSPGSITFMYLCGGPATGPIINAGHCLTTWPNYGAKVYMESMLGTQTLGTTFSGMTSGTPYDGNPLELVTYASVGLQNPWTVDCSCLGKTVVWLRLHYNDAIFANGLPQISFLVHGKNDIYDPRISPTTYGYSENAALCTADYLNQGCLTDGRNRPAWGYKAAYGTEIPLPQLIAAANICDEQVAVAFPLTSPATTEPRYALNGQFTLEQKRLDILKNMLSACAGRLTDYQGQYAIWPAAWAGVSAIIGAEASPPTSIYAMLTSGFTWRPKPTISDLYNGVKGTYISQVNNWEPSDFPRYAQDTYHGYTWGTAPQYDANLNADGGDRRWLDIQLPFTISCPTAQRIAKIELLRRRQEGTGTFPLNMAGYQFTPIDVIAMDLSYFGWTEHYLELLALRLKFAKQQSGASEEVVLMGVEIDVQETDPSVYEWSTGEELSPQGYQQSITPSTATPAPPTNFTGYSENGSVFLSWVEPDDAYVTNGGHIEVEYQLVQSPEGLWISLAKMDPTIVQAEIDNLTVGAQYNVQIRSVNAAGVPSAWIPASSNTSPPVVGPITAEAPALWQPDYEFPISGDPLFSEPGFGIDQSYSLAQNGSPLVSLDIYGAAPPTGLDLEFQLRRELVSGIFNQEVATVTDASPPNGTGTLAFGLSGMTPGEFVGRVLSKTANAIANISAHLPICDFLITANDGSTFTVMPDPVVAGCVPGDVFTLRTGGPGAGSPPSVTTPITSTSNSFTDSLFTNLYNPSGLIVHGNKGNLVLIIAGTGAGTPPQTVYDNTSTTVTIEGTWPVQPDATSVIVLLSPTSTPGPTANQAPQSQQALIASIPVPNYSGQVVYIEAYTVAANGLAGAIQSVPFREIYVWGAQGTRIVTASGMQMPTDGTLEFDTSGITGSTTTLGGGGCNNSTTSITVASGSSIVNGTYITILAEGSNTTESVLVESGGGTTSLTVLRAQLGTSASAHGSGATIDIGGALTFSLLPLSSIPNQSLFGHKITTDINYVIVQANTGVGDTFPGGGTQIVLSDTTITNGEFLLKAPG